MLTQNHVKVAKSFNGYAHNPQHNCKKINSTEVAHDNAMVQFKEIDSKKNDQEEWKVFTGFHNPTPELSNKIFELDKWSEIARVVAIISLPLLLVFKHPLVVSITLGAICVMVRNHFKTESLFKEMDAINKKNREDFKQRIQNLIDEINGS